MVGVFVFRCIYTGGLWEDDLHVSALKRVSLDLVFCE